MDQRPQDAFLCARPGINPNSSGHGIYMVGFALLTFGGFALVVYLASQMVPSSGTTVEGGIAQAPGDDIRVKTAVRLALRHNDRTGELLPKIDVQVDGAWVILTGSVPSAGESALVAEVARSAAGGRALANRLVISEAPAESGQNR